LTRGEIAAALDREWYHTIELAPGMVTPGWFDTRGVAPKLPFPPLHGKRCLDVGTFDGFWAFEMERRGAEVVAIDIDSVSEADLPPASRARMEKRAEEWGVQPGDGFRVAAAALGSSVRRESLNVYDLTPERIGGPVDVAFCGALLLHLRAAVGALERIRSSLVPGGRFFSYEPFSLPLTLRSPRRPAAEFQAADYEFNWWYPNLAGLRGWIAAAGFEQVRRTGAHRPRGRWTMTPGAPAARTGASRSRWSAGRRRRARAGPARTGSCCRSRG
jgi:tRNA (mo5U34)-methyltransferase